MSESRGGMAIETKAQSGDGRYYRWASRIAAGALIKNKLFCFANGDFTRRNFPVMSSISRAG